MIPFLMEVVSIVLVVADPSWFFNRGESTATEVTNAPTPPSSASEIMLYERRCFSDPSKDDVATSTPNHPLPFRLVLRNLRSLSKSTMLAVLSSTLSPGTAKPIPALLPDVEMIIVLSSQMQKGISIWVTGSIDCQKEIVTHTAKNNDNLLDTHDLTIQVQQRTSRILST